jgi:hypothetical protein
MTSTKSKPENWSMNTCKNGVTNTDHRYNYTNCTPLGIFFETLFKYVKPSLVRHQKNHMQTNIYNNRSHNYHFNNEVLLNVIDAPISIINRNSSKSFKFQINNLSIAPSYLCQWLSSGWMQVFILQSSKTIDTCK